VPVSLLNKKSTIRAFSSRIVHHSVQFGSDARRCVKSSPAAEASMLYGEEIARIENCADFRGEFARVCRQHHNAPPGEAQCSTYIHTLERYFMYVCVHMCTQLTKG
jgi:hypothetical protein